MNRFNYAENAPKNVKKCFKWQADVNEEVAMWTRLSQNGKKFFKRYHRLNSPMKSHFRMVQMVNHHDINRKLLLGIFK